MDSVQKKIKQYNFLPHLSLVALVAYVICIFVFNFTGVKSIFSLRWMLPVAAALLAVAGCVEVARAAINFKSEKSVTKLLIRLVALLSCLALAIAAFAKYFGDFAVYFADNNATLLILVCAFVLYAVYLGIENFDNLKSNIVAYALLGVIAVASIIVCSINVENTKIDLFYIYSFIAILAALLAVTKLHNDKVYKYLKLTLISIALLLVVAITILTMINRGHYDVINMARILAIVICIVFALSAIGDMGNIKDFKTLIAKACVFVVGLVMFYKLMSISIIDNTDEVRAFFSILIALQFISESSLVKDKKEMAFVGGYAIIGLVMFVVNELTIHVQKSYTSFYICTLVMVAALVLVRAVYVAMQIKAFAAARTKKNTEAENQKAKSVTAKDKGQAVKQKTGK